MGKLANIIKKGIVKALKEKNELGDRSTYIGASDIGGCLRKSYLDKTSSKELKEEQALIFMRGHLSEEILKKSFDAQGMKYEYQVELEDDFIKAHLDYLFINNKECVVVECKSSNRLPDSPYVSWVLQVQLQMYLAKKIYNKDVRGFIAVIDLAGEVVDFEIEYNEDLAKVALNKAKALWEALQNNEEPEAEEQLYCSKCPHKDTCPIFDAKEIKSDEVIKAIKELKALEKQKKELENKIKVLKSDLEEYFIAKDIKKAKIEDILVTLTSSSSYKSVDINKVKKEDINLYEELLEKYPKEVTRKASLRLK